jgi:hypothetical protein
MRPKIIPGALQLTIAVLAIGWLITAVVAYVLNRPYSGCCLTVQSTNPLLIQVNPARGHSGVMILILAVALALRVWSRSLEAQTIAGAAPPARLPLFRYGKLQGWEIPIIALLLAWPLSVPICTLASVANQRPCPASPAVQRTATVLGVHINYHKGGSQTQELTLSSWRPDYGSALIVGRAYGPDRDVLVGDPIRLVSHAGCWGAEWVERFPLPSP